MMFAMSKRAMRWMAWVMLAFWLGVGAASGGERGLLWKMELPGVPPSYLFGTIHTDDARVTDFSPELKQALQQSERFLMEALPLQDFSALLMKQGSLRDMLRPDEVALVLQLADQHSLREDVVLRMKPWLLASVFSLPQAQSPWTQDLLLYDMANSAGKQVLGLEQGSEHFGMLDDLSNAEQITLLRSVLVQKQEQKEQAFKTILQAYLSRDVERIAHVDEKMMEVELPRALWAKVKARLLDRRNARMAQRIAKQAAGAPVFVAVGAAHLAGEGGLLSRLRKAGFRLTALQ